MQGLLDKAGAYLFNPENSNTLLAIGTGLLQGTNPGGTFAQGAQAAFQNGLLAARQARRDKLVESQLAAAKQVQDQRQQQIDSFNRIKAIVGEPESRFEADLFPGEQPIPGLMNEGTGYRGGKMSAAEFQNALLPEFALSNPAAFVSLMNNSGKSNLPNDAKMLQFLEQNPQYMPLYEQVKSAGANKTTINTGDTKMVTPSDAEKIRLPDGSRPLPGTRYQDLAGMGATFVDAKTPEQAGKLTQLKVARDRIPVVEGLMFNQDGTVNRKNLFNSKFVIPGTDGQTMAAAYEAGIQAITRSETGAAMPPQEVENARKRFQPKITDTDETIRLKWDMYQDFLNGSVNLVEKGESGVSFDKDAFDAELRLRQASKAIDGAPKEFNGFKVLSVE